MAINLESAKAGTESVRLDRREAGARQDRWMLELEKAMISTAPDKQAGAVREPARTSAVVASHDSAAPASRAQTEAARERMPKAADVAASSGTVQRAAFVPTIVAAVAANNAQVAGPYANQRTGRAAPGAEGATPAQTGASLAANPLRAGGQLVAPLSQCAPQAAPEQAQAGGGAPSAGEQAQYDKRAMHVYVGADGVHAWIRDAALPRGQVNAVMQALAAEVALTGRNLAALTVNGKQVDPRGAAARPHDEDELFTILGDGGAASPSLSTLPHPVLKGNPTP